MSLQQLHCKTISNEQSRAYLSRLGHSSPRACLISLAVDLDWSRDKAQACGHSRIELKEFMSSTSYA